MHAGCRQAFGEDLEPVYRLDKADVVVASRCRFPGVGTGPAQGCAVPSPRVASRNSPSPIISSVAGRMTPPASAPMNRLYAIECTPTITGAAADHRVRPCARKI